MFDMLMQALRNRDDIIDAIDDAMPEGKNQIKRFFDSEGNLLDFEEGLGKTRSGNTRVASGYDYLDYAIASLLNDSINGVHQDDPIEAIPDQLATNLKFAIQQLEAAKLRADRISVKTETPPAMEWDRTLSQAPEGSYALVWLEMHEGYTVRMELAALITPDDVKNLQPVTVHEYAKAVLSQLHQQALTSWKQRYIDISGGMEGDESKPDGYYFYSVPTGADRCMRTIVMKATDAYTKLQTFEETGDSYEGRIGEPTP